MRFAILAALLMIDLAFGLMEVGTADPAVDQGGTEVRALDGQWPPPPTTY